MLARIQGRDALARIEVPRGADGDGVQVQEVLEPGEATLRRHAQLFPESGKGHRIWFAHGRDRTVSDFATSVEW